MAQAPEPSASERYCAWYGDAREGVLYFGQAAFWSAMRAAGGDPRADLAAAGPQRIGRFDLEREQLLPALDVTRPGARSGVWDVHAHENGRVYFTTFFEDMGWVDPRSGASGRFEGLGSGLNEIAPGPGSSLLVSRYGGPDGATGSIVWLSPDGELLAEHPIPAPDATSISGPKTPAWDPARREIWATDDVLARSGGGIRRDAVVLRESGSVRARVVDPEIQFAAFAPDGTGYFAEVDDRGLWLRRIPPDRVALLDADFARAFDFAQDLKTAADGRAVVTRWSGRVHVVAPDGAERSLALPPLEDAGLYYSGVVHGQRVCATYCGGVRVVCDDLAP